MSPISDATVNALIHPNRARDEQRDVAMFGAPALGLDRQPRHLQLQVVGQPEARVDVAPPRGAGLKAIEQFAARASE